MNALEELNRFQTDRGLDKKEFTNSSSMMNDIEETLELIGIHDDDSRTVTKEILEFIINRAYAVRNGVHHSDAHFIKATIPDKVDALADKVVFALGDILKLGFNPEEVLLEVGKEINSRVGTYVDGKFQKDKSPEAVAKWYKANLKGCKI